MEKTPIEKILDTTGPKLSSEKKAVLWERIEAATAPRDIPSPYLSFLTLKKPMVPYIVAVFFLLGAGGTAAAAESARPGDILFPIDQALEDVRLALANNDDAKARLKIAFAEERLAELKSLIDEDNQQDVLDTTPGDVTTLEAEADVFTNTTIVKVELNDRTTTFETTATTKDAIVAEIAQRFNLSEATVAAVLDFEVEDRASRVSDISKNTSHKDERVTTAVSLISELSDSFKDDDHAALVSELVKVFGTKGQLETRVDTDGDSRVEWRDEDLRVRIEEKDGEVRVKVRGGDDKKDTSSLLPSTSDDRDDRASRSDDSSQDDNQSSTSDDSSRDSADDSDNRVKIEVRVEDGMAEVRLENGSKRDEFTAPYTSRSALVTLLALRSGLSESIVEQSLDLEIKN